MELEKNSLNFNNFNIQQRNFFGLFMVFKSSLHVFFLDYFLMKLIIKNKTSVFKDRKLKEKFERILLMIE